MLKDIIDKWKINRNMLATKMEISKGAFNNKLSGRHPYKFSMDEERKLISILIDLKVDLEKVDDTSKTI